MKRFLLIGIGGVYNYGCEAIVRGTERLLHKKWPNSEIFYASSRPDDDRSRLRGCAVEIIRRGQISRYAPRNVARKLLSYLGISYHPCMDRLRHAKGMGAVISIGGDIYTLHANKSYNSRLVSYGDSLVSRHIPYILWGASVGPFSEAPAIEHFFAKHLSRITHITAREYATLDYLHSIGVTNNVSFFPDPAFFVAPHIVKPKSLDITRKPVIGINLSPLSAIHLGISFDKAIVDQSRTIAEIAQALDASIILIPHVYCSFNENDDDLRYLRKVRAAIPASILNRVTLIDTDPGFINLKNTLIQCDMVIAARMHCAISAISCHVPTLFLSYSQKSIGMCELVYGNRDNVCQLSSFSAINGPRIVEQFLQHKQDVQSHLSKRISWLQNEEFSLPSILLP